MANKAYTQEQIAEAKKLRSEKGYSWDEVALSIGAVSGEAIRKACVRYEDDDEIIPEQPDPTFLEGAASLIHKNKKNVGELSLEELFDGFISQQAFRNNFSIRQLTAEVEIETDKPIALSFLSDGHIGSPACAYESLYEDITSIQGNDRHFCALGGDMVDNFQTSFRDKSAPVWQLQPPQLQLLAVEKIMEYLNGKIVACIAGNHDAMDKRNSGLDSRYFIQRGKQPPYLPHGGLIELTVGAVTYKILWKHTYRFRSSLNQFNSHHRMLEVLCPNADIAVQEHEHNPGIESLEVGEFPKRTQVNIRTGAYKIDDGYSMDFYKSGRMGPQTVILWPDKRKILAMHGKDAIADAQTYLRGLTA